MSTKLILIVGIIFFGISTVGFGANLNTPSSFNNIGSNDNLSIPVPDADITNIVFTESANDIVSTTITVKNTDSTSHSYYICVITKAGIAISDTVGSSPDCSTTSSISGSNTDSVVISFTNPLSSSNVDFSDISIQQLS